MLENAGAKLYAEGVSSERATVQKLIADAQAEFGSLPYVYDNTVADALNSNQNADNQGKL